MGSIALYLLWILSSLIVLDATMLDKLNINGCISLTPRFIPFLRGHYVCKVEYFTDFVEMSLTSQIPSTKITLEHDGIGSPIEGTSPLTINFTTPVGNTDLKVKVENGLEYDLIFQRSENGNNYASHFNLTDCELLPNFEKDINEYTCIADTEVENCDISYAVEDRWVQSHFSEGGNELEFFKKNYARVVIFAQNDAKRVYTVEITRKPDPSTIVDVLEVPECLWSELKPAFNYSNPAHYYECRIFNNVSNLYVKVHLNSTRGTVEFNATNRNLRVGTNDIRMLVKAHDRISQELYEFFIIRKIAPNTTDDSNAFAMELSDCSLNQPFRTEILEYKCLNNFSNPRRILTKEDFMAPNGLFETNDDKSTWFLEGANPLKPFKNTINVTVISEDQSQETKYQIDIYREPNNDATLKNITITTAGLGGRILRPQYAGCHPEINVIPGKFDYACTVDYDVRTVHIMLQTTDPDAIPNPSTQNMSLQTNANGAIFQIRASNLLPADDKMYNLTITRGEPENNSMLSSLTIPGCNLSPAFSKHITFYSCILAKNDINLIPTVEADSVRASYTVTYPIHAGKKNETYAWFGRNLVEVHVTAENLHERIYTVSLTKLFSNSNDQQHVSLFTNMLVASILWKGSEDPMNMTQVITVLDQFVEGVDKSTLSPEVPKNRLAVVGIRPGHIDGFITIDVAIIPYAQWSLLDLRPPTTSDHDDHYVDTHFTSEFSIYKSSPLSEFQNFNGPNMHKIDYFQALINFRPVAMELIWPVNHRVSQVLGSTNTGNPSSFSTLIQLSLPGCDFDFTEMKKSYKCFTDNAINDPSQLEFELKDPDYAIYETTIPTSIFNSQSFYFGLNIIIVSVTAEDGSSSVYDITLTRSFLDNLNTADIKLYDMIMWSTEWDVNELDLGGYDVKDPIDMRVFVDYFIELAESSMDTKNRLAVVGARERSSSSIDVEIAFMPYIGTPSSGRLIPLSVVEMQYSKFLESNNKLGKLDKKNITMLLINITNKDRVSQVLGDTAGGSASRDSSLTSLNIQGCKFETEFNSNLLNHRCMMESSTSETVITLTAGNPDYSIITLSDGDAYTKTVNDLTFEFRNSEALNWGYNEIEILVQSEECLKKPLDCSKTTYKVTITRTLEPDFDNMCIDDPEGWSNGYNYCEDYELLQELDGAGDPCKSDYGEIIGTKEVKMKDACCFCGGGKQVVFADRKRFYPNLPVVQVEWEKGIIPDLQNVNTIAEKISDLISQFEDDENLGIPRNRLAVIGLRDTLYFTVIHFAVMPCTEDHKRKQKPCDPDAVVAEKLNGQCTSLNYNNKKAITCSKDLWDIDLFRPTWRVSQALGKTPNGHPFTVANFLSLTIEGCKLRKGISPIEVKFDSQQHMYDCVVNKDRHKLEYDYKVPDPTKEYYTVTYSIPTKKAIDSKQDFYFGHNEVRIISESETGNRKEYVIYVTRSFEDKVTESDSPDGQLTFIYRPDMEYIPTLWDIDFDINNADEVMKKIEAFTSAFSDYFKLHFNGDIDRIEVIGVRKATEDPGNPDVHPVWLDLTATQVSSGGYSRNQILRETEVEMRELQGAVFNNADFKKILQPNVARQKMNFLGISTAWNGTTTGLLGGKERIIEVKPNTPSDTEQKTKGEVTGASTLAPGDIILIVICFFLAVLCVCLVALCVKNQEEITTLLIPSSGGFNPQGSPQVGSQSPGPGIDLDKL